ncbi:MAG: SpoIID/LytB domain-containing protein [Bacillota bacterium]|jgi:stage II sporulation protein D|nr:SpoIID/LytB domain-containing protein [Candidatus Fermentithermobacillaceae bacterium]
MAFRFRDAADILRDNRIMVILGVVAAAAILLASRGQQMQPKGNIPTEEPTISVCFHETGEIKSMPLETYLEGVVAAEMDPNWPLAALEAQAIVARTFTLKKLQEGPLEGRNAQASTDPKEFQAYDASRVNDRVRQAVSNTRGKIITYRGEPIRAWFHSSSGGKTASASEGLNFTKESAPYAQPVTDVQTEPSHQWTARFSAGEVIQAARAVGVELDGLTSINIGRRGPSGRAETLSINGREVSAPQFRLAIGEQKMRSTLIDSLRLEGDTVYMKGRGFGHGVGMSQWGAWLLAQRGKSAQDIVTYYFKGVQIQNSWQ